ncbi:dipeptidase [Hyphodiscus hymeniophilus]|uniref:Dipeptidase n=1 Tax=Hyphodiscus hymeniophilus TaxID=353542 RepID=A0A9P6SQB0_9HELO|nr:dipeptidase [Hyphodiscus hymeniophilus]
MAKPQTSKPRSEKASSLEGSTWRGFILLTAILVGVFFYTNIWKTSLLTATKEESIDPKDYDSRAKRVLRSTPLIDGHNDFPFLLRQQLQSKIYDHDFEAEKLASHTDFQKMKDGMMGGQFWSVYVPCPADLVPGADLHDPHRHVPDLNEPNWAVRDTLEQIDLTKRLVAQYPKLLEFCTDPSCVRRTHEEGKVASMIGIEGGHQVGNSLGALRLLFETGARYVTLTHNCDNVFGTSWVSVDQATGRDAGLTKFGQAFVREMNRLGILIDLSHVSPGTMRDVLLIAKAPVIFSHSGAYGVEPHGRNVPDEVLKSLKHNGGVVMVPAVSISMNAAHPEEATVEDVIDHILHIADIAGWEHVGLGSDFDGTTYIVKGLEDVSQWPNLITRLLARGHVTDQQAELLVGGNLLRVWDEVERAAKESQEGGKLPSEESWEDRIWEVENTDVPGLFPEEL